MKIQLDEAVKFKHFIASHAAILTLVVAVVIFQDQRLQQAALRRDQVTKELLDNVQGRLSVEAQMLKEIVTEQIHVLMLRIELLETKLSNDG